MENTKIAQLTKASKDKSLSRAERKEAAKQLEWEKYRADKRPPMSFKKSTLYNGILSLTVALMFAYMGLAEQFDFKQSGINLTIFPFFLAAEIAALAFSVRQTTKYKAEPADDLATANMNYAGVISYAALIIIGAVGLLIMNAVHNSERFSMSYSALLFLFASFSSLQSALQKFIFLYIERGSDVDAEEDE